MNNNLPKDVVLNRSDIIADIVLARIGGAPFPAIAMLHDMEICRARYYAKRAVKEGLATKAELGMHDIPKPLRIPQERYAEHWRSRVMALVRIDSNGCWIWQGPVGTKGYGETGFRKQNVRVHRKLYELDNKVSLSPEQFVCHRCDVRRCCNPDHLFLGDNNINTADRTMKGRHHELRVTHCPQGHAYDEQNTYRTKHGSRQCKICTRERQRRKSV